MTIGGKFLSKSITLAKELGYKKIRLDTLPSMQPSLYLYREAGFYEIAPYRYNPFEDAIFLEKDLSMEG